MTDRILYIVAYDIKNQRRLSLFLNIVKDYATGGQKSAYECFLNPKEKKELSRRIKRLIKKDEDLASLVKISLNASPRRLGKARPINDPNFYYID